MTSNMIITNKCENDEDDAFLKSFYDILMMFLRFTTRWKRRDYDDHVMFNRQKKIFARNESLSCCLSRASVNERIAIESSSYELSWTTFTDISSYTTSNDLRMTMSEILLEDIRFSIFALTRFEFQSLFSTI
jgi:hypothetical protein